MFSCGSGASAKISWSKATCFNLSKYLNDIILYSGFERRGDENLHACDGEITDQCAHFVSYEKFNIKYKPYEYYKQTLWNTIYLEYFFNVTTRFIVLKCELLRIVGEKSMITDSDRLLL